MKGKNVKTKKKTAKAKKVTKKDYKRKNNIVELIVDIAKEQERLKSIFEEPIEFKDHQVHGGLDMFSSHEHSEDEMQVSQEFKAKVEYLSKELLGRFFYRIGKFFSKPKP